jgi:leucyl aminopeptidase
MTDRLEIVFVPLNQDVEPVAAVLVADELRLGEYASGLQKRSGGALLRAGEAAAFKGKARTSIELLGASDLPVSRLLLIGTGNPDEAKDADWVLLGGYAMGQLSSRKASTASLVAQLPAGAGPAPADLAADLAEGALLRSYKFSKYRTKKSDNGNGEETGSEETDPGKPSKPECDGIATLHIHTPDPAKARTAFERRKALADGVTMARDLVNEPANALGPVEFAERCRELEEVGVQVEVLDLEALQALKMGALLGVAQGSIREPRVVVMQWQGARSKRTKPLAFLGKGVTFDTGGVSIKPAGGMEDMKGDMAGAACVVGLMRALAQRKAGVNAVGIIGLVENMVSGTAQRPGDIVTSMSGQTVEVLNTDAEGRLVLGDVMWYAQDRFKPKLMVDLATLTGAIIIALGKEHAGLFANDDKLAADLIAAGGATGERVWRMPLDRAYDKLIDSRNADMKNIGGRGAGSITAAQFLGRFVKDGTPWAHLDVAGVAMDSAKTDISQGWASGWGVRLLDRLVADGHEKGEKG